MPTCISHRASSTTDERKSAYSDRIFVFFTVELKEASIHWTHVSIDFVYGYENCIHVCAILNRSTSEVWRKKIQINLYYRTHASASSSSLALSTRPIRGLKLFLLSRGELIRNHELESSTFEEFEWIASCILRELTIQRGNTVSRSCTPHDVQKNIMWMSRNCSLCKRLLTQYRSCV